MVPLAHYFRKNDRYSFQTGVIGYSLIILMQFSFLTYSREFWKYLCIVKTYLVRLVNLS